jgi:hypothetical protein
MKDILPLWRKGRIVTKKSVDGLKVGVGIIPLCKGEP